VTLLDELILLISEKTQICIQFLAGCKQFHAAPSRIARKALTICGIIRTNSAVILLTSTTTVPIYGKLADLFGRKPIFLFGTRK